MSIKFLFNSSTISSLIAFTIVMLDRYIFEPAIYTHVSIATMCAVTGFFAIAIEIVANIVHMLVTTLHAEWQTHRALKAHDTQQTSN